MSEADPGSPELGDLVVLLLTSTLEGLRDRLHTDGFSAAAEVVADMVDIADDYIVRVRAETSSGR